MNFSFSSLSKTQKGVFLMLSCIALTVVGVLGARYAVNMYSPPLANILFWSMLGSSLASLPYIFSKKKHRDALKSTLCFSPWLVISMVLLSVLSTAIWIFLIQNLSAETVSLFDQAAILWAVCIGFLFLKERFSFLQIFALTFAVLGMYLFIKGDSRIDTDFLLLLLGNPLLYTLQSFILKKYGSAVDAMSLAIIRVFGMMICFGLVFISLGMLSYIPVSLFFLLLFTQSLSLVLAKGLYFKAHSYLPFSFLNLFYLLVPILVALFSPFIELLFFWDWKKSFGMFLVIVGIFVFMYKNK